MYHRAFARVSLDAIEHNFDALKSLLPPGTKALAVVKANAYGHGAVPVSRRLEPKADAFAVACLEEALELRGAGIQKPILILSYTDPSLFDVLIRNDVTATVYTVRDAGLLSDTAQKIGKKARVHAAVDTGMGRIGFLPDEEGADAILAVSRLPGIELEGIFSHYACADERDLTDANGQTERFDHILALLEARGVKIHLRHICNSAATLEFPNKYDLCRFGISLYGYFPSNEVCRTRVPLVPAMQVFCHVIHVKTVPEGTKISYGHIWTAPEERRIATVSVGYADGYNRCMTGVGCVLLHGKRAPIVGRVCMDQMMVDVTGIGNVAVGDLVTLMGRDGEEEFFAEEFASLTHSLSYEVLCTFMPRVTRVYEEE